MLALRTVPADHLPGGFADFRIREDFVESYQRVRASARALGGVVTSSGAIRDLHEPATQGRSRTSLHYTGRALDLYVESGMRSARNPYAVVPVRTGGTVRWTIWCESVNPQRDSEQYDETLIVEQELRCAVWKANVGYTLVSRSGRFFSLTALFVREGWLPIPARSDWKTSYLSCEWWHFQNQTGLQENVTKFGTELRQVWSAALVNASGLALEAVWSGQSFKAKTPTPPIPAAPAGDEKVVWMQSTLNAIAGEALRTDGDFGTRTIEALRRFQAANALPVTGVCDAHSEIALVQRALERIGHTVFPAIGTRDAITTEAIRRFQESAGLGVDGILGPNTRTALEERLATSREPVRLPATRTTRPARRGSPA